MHKSVMRFIEDNIKPDEVSGKSVLEIGSFDVNGSPRGVIQAMGCSSYCGVDLTAGPGVDRVMDVAAIQENFPPNSFDLVISAEMLEHAMEWKVAVTAMKTVLRPGGFLYVTTRSPGFPYHGYPYDYWRFTAVDFSKIFKDMEIIALQLDSPITPGIFLKARKPDPFTMIALDMEVAKIEVPALPKPPPGQGPCLGVVNQIVV